MFRMLNHKKMNDIVDKEIYIEILRILAVLFVIFNHTDGYYLYYSVYYGKNVPLFRRNGYRKSGAMIP